MNKNYIYEKSIEKTMDFIFFIKEKVLKSLTLKVKYDKIICVKFRENGQIPFSN